ncbi:hypothetical protein [Pelagibius sp.]|uniref:hypothetical protein n=1 Tax=Pelagibius sp. TaxID=1931238 RepID=UPI003B501E2B
MSKIDVQLDAYEEALAAALSELAEVKVSIHQHRQSLNIKERRRRELLTAIDNLIVLLPAETQKRWSKRLSDVDEPKSLDASRASREQKAIAEAVENDPSRTWTFDEIQTELERVGIRPKPKVIYNAIQRLANRGDLVRISRGKYRSRQYGFGLITTENLLDD